MTNATFSPESEFGGTPFAALGGLTIAEFGAALAPANLSARQAAALGLTTSGTCGPRGTTSSRSAALQESLANKLQAKTGSGGSILYRLTWKTRVTPSGLPICALRGSPNKGATVADFTCGSGSILSPSTGWPTPRQTDGEKNMRSTTGADSEIARKGGPQDLGAAQVAGWPSPTVGNATGGQKPPEGTTATGRTPEGRKVTVALPGVTSLAGWNTPVTNDAEKRRAVDPMRGNGLAGQGNLAGWATPLTNATKDVGNLESYLHGSNGRFRNDSTTTQAVLAGWPTPHMSSGTGPGAEGRAGGLNIQTAADLAAWPTPNAGDEKWRYSNAEIVARRKERGGQLGLEAIAMLSTVPADCTAFLIMTPDGQTQTSFIAATGGGVQLNPGHSRWLMRFPVQWQQCAPNYEPYALLQALASAT